MITHLTDEEREELSRKVREAKQAQRRGWPVSAIDDIAQMRRQWEQKPQPQPTGES